jgi:hypothetical protein
MLSAGTAYALAVNDDRNCNVAKTRLQGLPLNVGPRFDRLISAAQGHQLASHRTACTLRLRGRALHGDSVDREADTEVTDVGDECASLSTIDRYQDV